ncbi:MAG: YckD family protein [Peptococcaceae bacterium]|jgi:hypothetical protein|nr:YckD family protein [Peptococcaceae bacterium]
MRKLAVGLLTFAMLTFSAGSVLGAVDAAKLEEMKALTQQMYSLKTQLIDKQVDAGLLDQSKAAEIKQHLAQRQKQIEQDLANGQFNGFGKKKGSHCEKQSAPASPQATPSHS